ncbi:cysteine desulfurase family protein [Sediminicurvatus halobius]|uniref:cysteine desulfurase n=1 Tax=Sediminicurvatus halobius TaxID=2182432 RepID=A0A2U2N4P9_9GAMM|nr:cysteine desulfurase family protein [Spiribacter halobius]PWG64053.1 IscS subfamily cysteine desulfurase [Spiribacter halobius]UEX76892.1 cysteine desulfurase [Spiribacter halobius]
MVGPYLDHAATTPVDPRVVERMLACLDRAAGFGNPASSHAAGSRARAEVARAAETVAAALGGEPEGVVWTSGATEADNLAILGTAQHLAARDTPRRRLVTLRTEHAAVLEPMRAARALGFRVDHLTPEPDGRLPPERLAETLGDDVALVSLAQVNNETGVVQDLAALGGLAREAGAVMHVDAAQGAGRLPLDLASQPVDLVSISAHKCHGPAGVGALYVRPGLRLAPLLHGGGQQGGLRSGTLPLHQIVGLAETLRLAVAERASERERLRGLYWRLRNGLRALGDVVLNGRDDGSPHILNVSFAGVHGEALRAALGELAVGYGSACSGGGASHVLRAMGRPDALADAAVRFSLGRFSAEAEVDAVLARFGEVVPALRRVSPLARELATGVPLSKVYRCKTPLPVA